MPTSTAWLNQCVCGWHARAPWHRRSLTSQLRQNHGWCCRGILLALPVLWCTIHGCCQGCECWPNGLCAPHVPRLLLQPYLLVSNGFPSSMAETQFLASTREFLSSSMTFSLVLTRSTSSWASLFNSSISRFSSCCLACLESLSDSFMLSDKLKIQLPVVWLWLVALRWCVAGFLNGPFLLQRRPRWQLHFLLLLLQQTKSAISTPWRS